MSELYHIKKKKSSFDETESKSISTFGSSISSMGKKAKNIVDRIQSSSDFQKVKIAQKVKKDQKDSDGPFISKGLNSIKNIGSSVGNKASGYATSAKAAKKLDDMKTYADEAEKDMMDNPPKKLRKKLNPTKLKEIVGPKKRG